MKKYHAKIRMGINSMKLETSLMRSFPRSATTSPPSTNAGNADRIRNSSSNPGSTQISRTTQFSLPLSQGIGHHLRWFAGSESKRIADHQKYLLGGRCIF